MMRPQSLDEGFLNMPSPYYNDLSLPPAPLRSKVPVVNPETSQIHAPTTMVPIPTTTEPRLRAQTAAPPQSLGRHSLGSLHQLSTYNVSTTPTLCYDQCIPAPEGRDKQHATVLHDAFPIKELDRKYTCYHTQKTDSFRLDRYERIDGVYDHYWRDLLGGSDGYVYTMSDGGVKEARFGIFHQLECLYQVRKAVRGLGRRSGEENGKEKRKDFVFVGYDGAEDAKGWEHCSDYLRQVVLCGADDTVEFSDGVGKGAWDSFGYGGRQCRDPKWLFDVTKCGRRGCNK